MSSIGIIGAGEFGVTVSQHLIALNKFDNIYFIDDTKIGESVNGIPVICGISDINKFYNDKINILILCIGYNHLDFRFKLFNDLKENGYSFFTFIHESVVLGEDVNIEEGAIIFPGAIIDNGVTIGVNSLINSGAIIAHDSHIEGHTFVAPGVNIAGFVKIGKRCFIGIGTTIIDHLNITDDVVLAANTLVLKDITEKGKYIRRTGKLEAL